MELRDFAEQILFANTQEEDPAFIAELDVYSQSKGRTPGVFIFNPFAEGYLAGGKAFTPTAHQAQLARDLANLPQFLCRRDDLVLLEKRPSVEFLNTIQQAAIPLPEFVEFHGGHFSNDDKFRQRKIGRLRPWAWGPDSVELLAPLFAQLTSKTVPSDCFNEKVARLYSKAWSAGFLRSLLEAPIGVSDRVEGDSWRWKDEPWLCGEDEAGVAVNTEAEALAAIEAIRRRGHHKVVVKEALGLAGQNAIRLWEPEMLETQRQWMAHRFDKGLELVVEPWLEREIDFSVQLEMSTQGLKLIGYTGLINDLRGHYQANWAASGYDRRAPAKVVMALTGPRDLFVRLHRLYADLIALLEVELRKAAYAGPVGIDAFVYRTPTSERRLKPIVEINPRYTMGRVTLELMKYTCPGTQGWFRLLTAKMVKAEGFADFGAYAGNLATAHPVRLQGHPVPQILEGALCLNDPRQAQVCLAVFQVERSST